jgi:hypothetical protein
LDFFEQQDEARRNSRWLILWYAAAVLLVVASYCAAAALAYAPVLKLGWSAPLGRETLDSAKVSQSLERLRHLAPLAKPAILKACVALAAADGVFRLAEAELVRTIAATLDCPVPPVLAAHDPQALAA